MARAEVLFLSVNSEKWHCHLQKMKQQKIVMQTISEPGTSKWKISPCNPVVRPLHQISFAAWHFSSRLNLLRASALLKNRQAGWKLAEKFNNWPNFCSTKKLRKRRREVREFNLNMREGWEWKGHCMRQQAGVHLWRLRAADFALKGFRQFQRTHFVIVPELLFSHGKLHC